MGSSSSSTPLTPRETSSQSACVTPSGLSMYMRSKWLRPEPFNSTSTISMPAGAAACSAMAVIFEMVSSRFIFVSSKLKTNKKVGFRPLCKFVRQPQYNKETDPSTTSLTRDKLWLMSKTLNILRAAALLAFASVSAPAQWLNYPAPGIPRTPDGKPNLSAPTPRTADGKPDLSGVWSGPGAGSYDRNIARDLKPADIQPWAETIYQQRVLNEGKDAPRANCLPDPFVYYHAVDVARLVQTSGLILVVYQGTTNSVH